MIWVALAAGVLLGAVLLFAVLVLFFGEVEFWR